MDFNKMCTHCMKEVEAYQGQPCPNCGHAFHMTDEIHHQLKPFTILQGKYLVGDMLGEGGFGITYIGMEINLEIKVAIKEFYPNGYCTREAAVTNDVTIYQGQSMEAVLKWKDNFLKEAKCLGKCADLPGVVGVRDYFQENGTAYIVMEYLEGMTLKEYVNSFGGKISAETLLPALEPVILSLGEVHRQGLIHRDISPDNVMLLPSGSMKLLDFGAARDYINNGGKSLSVMLKPGYAPEEQYRSKGKQGPWSDVYAFAGTIYRCLTGITPPDAMERMRSDELIYPSRLGVQLTPQQEAALMKALAVYAEDRYQSMEEFHAGLYGNVIGHQIVASVHREEISHQTVGENEKAGTQTKQEIFTSSVSGQIVKKTDSSKNKLIIACASGAVVLLLVIVVCGIALLGKKGKKADDQVSLETQEGVGEGSVVSVEVDEQAMEELQNQQLVEEALVKYIAEEEEGRAKLDEAEDYLNQAWAEISENGGNIWENETLKNDAMGSAYEGIQRIESAMEGYQGIAEQYGYPQNVQKCIDGVGEIYQDGILLRISMLQLQPVSSDIYAEIVDELNKAIDFLQDDAGKLETKREEISEWYKEQYCLAFNQFTQRDNWSRSEAWELMSDAYEAGLIETEDLDDPLRLRYCYAYAYYIEKWLENNNASAFEASEIIYSNLEITDFNLMMMELWIDCEYQQGNSMRAGMIETCFNEIWAIIWENEGEQTGNVSTDRLWEFNDFEHYTDGILDGEWNGLSKETKEQIRGRGQTLLEELKQL